MSENICVLGAGSFGLALAKLMAEGGHRVIVYARDHKVSEQINTLHRHPNRLDSMILPRGIKATSDYEEAMLDTNIIVSAIPTVAVRKVWSAAKQFLKEDTIIVSATKGIENDSLMLVSDILESILDEKWHPNLAYLSGPSFALELAHRMPTLVVAASKNMKTAERIQELFSTDYFRIYTNNDVVGVELGGALKNVIAIATGVADGLQYGLNSQVAIITRGLAEIRELALKMGAKNSTISGLSGMGDLVLTGTGTLSRNRRVGKMLGQGMQLDEILENLGEVAEGVNTTKSILKLAELHHVKMPISAAVYRLLFDPKTKVRSIVQELMSSDLKSEENELKQNVSEIA